MRHRTDTPALCLYLDYLSSLIIASTFRLYLSRRLSADPMLRNYDFRRFWLTCAIAGFGEQISNLAIPLTAVLLLHATPSQMGTLIALQMAPFALFALPVVYLKLYLSAGR